MGFQQTADNRGTDVVGDVRHDEISFAQVQLFRRDFEDVAFHYLNVIIFTNRLGKRGNQTAVNFHRDNPPDSLRQQNGQAAQPRADFKDGVLRAKPGSLHNLFQPAGVYQKVLPERFFRLQPIRAQQGRRVQISARHGSTTGMNPETGVRK